MNPEVISLLQSSLKDEAQATLQYELHSVRVAELDEGPLVKEVSDHLQEHADKELEHYQRLCTRLNQLGLKPEFGSSPMIHKGDHMREVVAAHQEAETGAIRKYERLVQLTQDDVETNELVRELLEDEVEHLQDFREYEEKKMARELKFASEEAALQHLANVTGSQVKVGASERAFNTPNGYGTVSLKKIKGGYGVDVHLSEAFREGLMNHNDTPEQLAKDVASETEKAFLKVLSNRVEL
jgi:bacterioferritin (cytochrome b1)